MKHYYEGGIADSVAAFRYLLYRPFTSGDIRVSTINYVQYSLLTFSCSTYHQITAVVN